MGGLEVRLFGCLSLLRDAEPVKLPASKKARALLAYLVITRRPHTRSRLCSLLWDVTDDPRGALRWCLSKVRHLVGAERIITGSLTTPVTKETLTNIIVTKEVVGWPFRRHSHAKKSDNGSIFSNKPASKPPAYLITDR